MGRNSMFGEDVDDEQSCKFWSGYLVHCRDENTLLRQSIHYD
jgi:hypothetical protein